MFYYYYNPGESRDMVFCGVVCEAGQVSVHYFSNFDSQLETGNFRLCGKNLLSVCSRSLDLHILDGGFH